MTRFGYILFVAAAVCLGCNELFVNMAGFDENYLHRRLRQSN